MNALYGATGNEHFTGFFDKRNAEAVTLSGQLSITWVAVRINNLLNKVLGTGEMTGTYVSGGSEGTTLEFRGDGVQYVTYADTDSLFLDFSAFVDKKFTKEEQKDVNKVADWLSDLFKNRIEPALLEYTDELADYMNAYENRMFMKRENIALSAVWVAKKRYAMMVIDSEGVRYTEPRLKVTGLESVRGTTPEPCREWLKDCYKTVLLSDNESDLHDLVSKIKVDFMKLEPEDIASSTGVNNLEKYSHPIDIYVKGTPQHVRGALFHNHLLKKNNIESIFPINSGDKAMVIPIKKENPLGFDVFSFVGYIAPEFNIRDYVDYQTAYEKTFLAGLENFLKPTDWTPEPVASLKGFFM